MDEVALSHAVLADDYCPSLERHLDICEVSKVLNFDPANAHRMASLAEAMDL